MTTFEKDPDEYLDYSIDWTNVLESGETISDSVWLAPGLTIGSESVSSSVCTVWLSGGVSGSIVGVVNRITTSAGRIYEQTFVLVVVNNA